MTDQTKRTITIICNKYKLEKIFIDKQYSFEKDNDKCYYFETFDNMVDKAVIYIVVLNWQDNKNNLGIKPLSVHMSNELAQRSLYNIIADGSNTYAIYECNILNDNGKLFADKINKKYELRISTINGHTYKLLSNGYNGSPVSFTKWIWQTDDEFRNDVNDFVSKFYSVK